jgi:hypothetical protein
MKQQGRSADASATRRSHHRTDDVNKAGIARNPEQDRYWARDEKKKN